MKKLSKKQVHSLLEFLDTLAVLDLNRPCSVIWELKPRTTLDMYWNITRDDPQSVYAVSIRNRHGAAQRFVLDVHEDDK